MGGVFNSQGKRLTGSFGSMHGLKIPEKATPDDMPKEELPYLEMLYRFVLVRNPITT